MHDTIYQISENRINPKSRDYMTQQSVRKCSDFMGHVADYVYEPLDAKDRQGGIDNLKDDIGHIATFGSDDTLVINDKRPYFEPKFLEFIECAQRATQLTLDEFIDTSKKLPASLATRTSSGSITFNAKDIKHRLDKSFNKDMNTYVCDAIVNEIPHIITLDEFMRKAPENTTLYINGIVGYHR